MGGVQARLKRESPPGAMRWARPEQFHVTLELGRWTVDCVELIRSELSPDGARPEAMGRYPLELKC